MTWLPGKQTVLATEVISVLQYDTKNMQVDLRKKLAYMSSTVFTVCTKSTLITFENL